METLSHLQEKNLDYQSTWEVCLSYHDIQFGFISCNPLFLLDDSSIKDNNILTNMKLTKEISVLLK